MVDLKFIASFAAAFFVGSIPTGFLIAKYFKGIDIRQYGSGNVGATNISRVLGKGLGIFVFCIDFAKGVLPVVLLPILFYPEGLSKGVAIWIGLGAIIGHIYTPFLGFKGGKGVATGVGVIGGGYPVIFCIVMSVWLVIFLFTRVVSLSSLLAIGSLVICGFLFGLEIAAQVFFVLIFFLGLWTHRENIERLIRGEEKRF